MGDGGWGMEYTGRSLEYEGQKAENGKWRRMLDGNGETEELSVERLIWNMMGKNGEWKMEADVRWKQRNRRIVSGD